MILIRLIFSQIFFILTGGFIYNLIFGERENHPSLPSLAGLIYLMGLGGLSFLLFLAGFFGLNLGFGLMLFIALSCGVGWVILIKTGARRFPGKKSAFFLKTPSLRFGKEGALTEYFLILLLVVLVFVQFQYAFRLPLMGFDSRAHWAFKTKILHYEKTFRCDSFYEPDRLHPQVRHPLLLPIIQLVVTRTLGDYDDRLMKLPLALMYLSALLFYHEEMKRLHKTSWALGFTLLLASIPQLITPSDGGVTSGYADAPLALFYLGAVIFLARWIKSGKNHDLLAGLLFAIFCAYTKDDGLGCAFASFVALVISSLLMKNSNRKARFKGVILFCALFPLFLLPGKIYSRSMSLEKGEYLESLLNPVGIRNNLKRLGVILQAYKMELLLNFPRWGILWLILVISVICNARFFKLPRVGFVAMSVLFYFLVLTTVFIILPWALPQFFAGSLSRLLLHVAPVCAYLIALLWSYRAGLSETNDALAE